MNILLMLSKLKRSPKMAGIRQYTNLLYYDPNFITLDMRKYDVIEVDGCKFWVNDQIGSTQRMKDNPWFGKIRSTDIVVDVGANIGAITIPLAKVAKKVYAIEPLFGNELEANLKLNELKNVEIVPIGIGREHSKLIKFGPKSAIAPIITFSELRERIGGRIDFLKMDGEGCEWEMKPSELKGIRELRMEFHIHRGRVRECRRMYKEYLDWMKAEGYEINITYVDIGPNPYNSEDPEVRASLR